MEIPYADQSGYGPSSAGNAPTAAERRQNAFNRFHNYRVADAMQYIDPYVRTIGMSASQALTDSSGGTAAATIVTFPPPARSAASKFTIDVPAR